VKVQCELCREIVVLADFTPSAEGISIHCPACDGTYFVPAPRPDPGRDGAAPGPAPPPAASTGEPAAGDACPKCGRRQPPADACRHCGLVFALWDPASAPTAAGDEEARRLFARAEEAWGETARHEAFIEHCSRTAQLPYAARRYRERLTRNPDDAVARAQQARVVTITELTYLTRPRELADAPWPHRGALIGLVIAVFLLLLGLLTSPLWRWWK
jgi:hypothetical protein